MNTPSVNRLASPQEAAFARAYALTHSVTRAAETAELDPAEAKALMRTTGMQNEIEEQRRLLLEGLTIRTDRITQELAAIGFADPANFYNPDGSLIPLHEMPPHVRACIKSIEVREMEDILPDGTVRTVRKASITLHDKLKALDIASKVTGLYDRPEDETPVRMQMGKAKTGSDSEPELEFLPDDV